MHVEKLFYHKLQTNDTVRLKLALNYREKLSCKIYYTIGGAIEKLKNFDRLFWYDIFQCYLQV